MMEFLDKIFGYEYFGAILFAVIAVLIVLFFIILFFGKKDEKERKLEETKRLEALANVNAFKDESEESKIEIENNDNTDIESSLVKEEMAQIDAFNEFESSLDNDQNELEKEVISLENVESSFSNVNDSVLENEPILMPIEELPLITNNDNTEIQNAPVFEEEKEEMPFRIEPTIPTNVPKYSFEELANSISKELEEIEKLSSKSIEKENVNEEPKVELERAHVEVTPIKEIQKRGGMPVFSSVFVPSAKKEESEVNVNISDIKQESTSTDEVIAVTETIFEKEVDVPKVEEESKKIDFSKLKSESVSVTKTVDLPKTVELPKKTVVPEKKEVVSPDFSNIEGESYEIK